MKKVGGHPKSIELLEGWLSSGRVTDLLNDPRLDGLLAQQWEEYFLRALLAQLTPAQHEAFARLSVFCTPLGDEEFTYAGADAHAVDRWLDLSLLERAGPDRYSIHEVVRQYLMGQMAPAEGRALHTWAATYYGRDFTKAAQDIFSDPGLNRTDEDVEVQARTLMVKEFVHQTHKLDTARAAMAYALEWQHHLYAAQAYEAAADIANAVWDILERWGQSDRAKALLRQSIVTLEGARKGVTQVRLGILLMHEGQLDEALATYEAVYQIFKAQNARPDMAMVLANISQVY
jgi:tetratricopeptide (TPR) repeat protein